MFMLSLLYDKMYKIFKKNLEVIIWWLHIQSGHSFVGVSCVHKKGLPRLFMQPPNDKKQTQTIL